MANGWFESSKVVNPPYGKRLEDGISVSTPDFIYFRGGFTAKL
jgi:uncharacterized RmlC-like cupin family protein